MEILMFRTAIDREELLIRKCRGFYDDIKNKEIMDIVKDIESTAQEHIKALKDKMIKLNIQG